MLQEFSLKDKVALVTGAGSPISQAIITGLAQAGASIAAVSTDESAIESLVAEINSSSGKAISLNFDVTDEAQVKAMVEKTMAEFGRLDILVNGQSADLGKPMLETSLDEWHRVFDLNVTSVFLCSREVAPIMEEQGLGKIINISSALAVRVVVDGAAYCATQGAISQLTQALGLEWGPKQISINSIAVGWFADGPVDLMEDLKQQTVRMVPQRRRGQPEEVAGMVVYLASSAGSYTTGQTILLDGGAHTHA